VSASASEATALWRYRSFIIIIIIMNRPRTRLRKRMTSDHFHRLLLIFTEGPDVLTRAQLKEIVYLWYAQKPRRIQLLYRLNKNWHFWKRTSKLSYKLLHDAAGI